MTYVSGSYQGIDRVVNKFYVNIGSVNVHNGDVNNGIQHSISAQQVGDVQVYNNVETLVNNHNHTTNYVVNMDNRKVDFLSPYSGHEQIGTSGAGYLEHTGYKMIGHDTTAVADQEYQGSIMQGMLKKNRPVVQFVEDAEEIRGLVEETFEKMTGEELPRDIAVRVCDEDMMKKAHSLHGGVWNPGIQGFAINEQRMVFARKNDLDMLMMVLGHEIGHVLTTTLGDAISEEAKAFSFEMAWVKTIIENDIGRLAGNFNPDFVPAANGLHDRAFAFVQKHIAKGKKAFDVFEALSRGELRFSE